MNGIDTIPLHSLCLKEPKAELDGLITFDSNVKDQTTK